MERGAGRRVFVLVRGGFKLAGELMAVDPVAQTLTLRNGPSGHTRLPAFPYLR